MSERGYMASPIRQRLTVEGICAGLIAWVAWDWGSAAFNVVISFVFSPYLAGAVAADETTGSAALGWATAIAGLIIAASRRYGASAATPPVAPVAGSAAWAH